MRNLALAAGVCLMILTGCSTDHSSHTTNTGSIVQNMELTSDATVAVTAMQDGPLVQKQVPTLGDTELAAVTVTLDITGFVFADGDGSAVPSGHVHVYANGKLIGTAVGPEYVTELPAGSWEIQAVLATTMHQEYTRNGEVVAGSTKLEVK